MSFLIEQLRSDQEEIEYLKRSIVKSLFLKSQNPRNVIISDFMIKNFLNEIQVRSERALKNYKDEDSLKKSEVQFLEGEREGDLATGTKSLDVWLNYYEKLNSIKDYHDKFTSYGAPAEVFDSTYFFLHALDDPSKIPKFSGPEGYGRFIDLNSNYIEFINLKKIQKNKDRIVKSIDYVSYLSIFDQFHTIPISCKDKAYSEYLGNLLSYLKGYYSRTKPLFDIEVLQESSEKWFEAGWAERSLRGWEFIPNNLKTDPLYCLPCKKLFNNKNVYKAHKKGNRHKKAVERVVDMLDENPDTQVLQELKDIARTECFIAKLREYIGDIIEDSINNIRKKQTRTAEELEMYESDQEEPFKLPAEELKKKAENKVKEESSDSENEKPAYNPLNLPIGFDGKPIPYWLYKLHGLNVEYKCEICGNYSYWGRRAFERHFQEWRHAHGMRCLRIPNTMHFREITKINEALQLHKKLMQDHQMDMFRPDEEEECEDNLGNVMTRKKFNDLKRQGYA